MNASLYKTVIFILCLAVFSAAQALETKNRATTLVNCVDVNNNFTAIKKNIKQGSFRYTTKFNKADLPVFSFQTQQSFQQYINYINKLIIAKNPQALRPCTIATKTHDMLAKLNGWGDDIYVNQLIAPYELPVASSQLVKSESSKVILLIHGLTDSPFLFHDLTQYFHQQGFTVRTLLLPGHGTAASDLIDVTVEQWQQTTKYGIERTLLDFDEVYLGGFSTGGALIFDYLMQQKHVSEKIKGLMMWSPASKANDDLAWLAKYVDLIPFVDWIDLDADIDFAKYESFSYNAGAKVHELMSNIVGEDARKNNYIHDIPLFVVASEHDQTIDTTFTLRLINQWQQAKLTEKSPNNTIQDTLIYYGDISKAQSMLSPKVQVISPVCQKDGLCVGVYDIAHTATTNAPSNPHYGVKGQYRNCGHYLADMKRYQQCKMNDEVLVGETTKENLQHSKPLKRLTYNPYYEQMLVAMTKFLSLIKQ